MHNRAMEVIAYVVLVLSLALVWPAISRGQDPTGFTEALNGERAARGLTVVAIGNGTNLVSARNNELQRQRGLGHFYTGGLAQCAAIGCSDVRSALQMWTNSPSHASILYSPNLVSVGFACDGWAASVACQMGYSTIPLVPMYPQMVQPRRFSRGYRR